VRINEGIFVVTKSKHIEETVKEKKADEKKKHRINKS